MQSHASAQQCGLTSSSANALVDLVHIEAAEVRPGELPKLYGASAVGHARSGKLQCCRAPSMCMLSWPLCITMQLCKVHKENMPWAASCHVMLWFAALNAMLFGAKGHSRIEELLITLQCTTHVCLAVNTELNLTLYLEYQNMPCCVLDWHVHLDGMVPIHAWGGVPILLRGSDARGTYLLAIIVDA